MTFRKINFNIKYSVIFAATLYFSMFFWSSDFLNFAFMNVFILVKANIYNASLFKVNKLISIIVGRLLYHVLTYPCINIRNACACLKSFSCSQINFIFSFLEGLKIDLFDFILTPGGRVHCTRVRNITRSTYARRCIQYSA